MVSILRLAKGSSALWLSEVVGKAKAVGLEFGAGVGWKARQLGFAGSVREELLCCFDMQRDEK